MTRRRSRSSLPAVKLTAKCALSAVSAIVDRGNREVVKVVNHPDLAQRYAADGAVKYENERWGKLIRESGSKGD